MKKRNYLSDVEDRSGNAFSVIADFEGNEEQLMDIEVDRSGLRLPQPSSF